MNIAIFVDAYLPVKNGVVTSVNQLKVGLDALGHHVFIFTTEHHDAEPMPDVYRFPSIKFGRKSENYLGLVSSRLVSKLIRELKIDLLHSHSEFALGMAAKKAAKKHDLPLVHTNHTLWIYYKHYLPSWVYSVYSVDQIFRTFQGDTRYFIAPSIKAQKFYAPFSRPDAVFRVIPNGVDQSKFLTQSPDASQRDELRTLLGILPTDRVAMFAGRVGPEKRIAELVAALVPLLRRRSEFKFLAVGDGPAMAEVRDLVAREGLEKSVLLPGFVPWQEMSLYYSLGHVFLSASISEVHPMTLIEAAIASLPAITRDDDAFRPLLQEGINGHLAVDDATMALRLEALLDDEPRRQAYATAMRRAADDYTADVHVRHVLEYYEFILADHRQNAAKA